jgi:ATP-dependent protease ClpP protease subunit
MNNELDFLLDIDTSTDSTKMSDAEDTGTISENTSDDNLPQAPSPYSIDKGIYKYPPLYATKRQGETGTHYTFNLQGCVPINSKMEYFPLIEVLLNAKDGDTVDIYINSPGGMIEIGSIIASIMCTTKAKITTINIGDAASIAAFIWSLGHEQIVHDNTEFLFHMAAHGDTGFSTNIEERAKNLIKYVGEYLLKVSLVKGHITEEEYNDILFKNKTVIVQAEEMKQRLANSSSDTSSGLESFFPDMSIVDIVSILETDDVDYDKLGNKLGTESFFKLSDIKPQMTGIDKNNMEQRAQLIRKKYPNAFNKKSNMSGIDQQISLNSLNPNQLNSMLFECIPIAIKTYENNKYLFVAADDLGIFTYDNNLSNYLDSLDPNDVINVFTFHNLFSDWALPRLSDMTWFINKLKHIPNHTIAQAHGIIPPVASIVHLNCKDIRFSKYTQFQFTACRDYSPWENGLQPKEASWLMYKDFIDKGWLTMDEYNHMVEEFDSGKIVTISGTEMARRMNIQI